MSKISRDEISRGGLSFSLSSLAGDRVSVCGSASRGSGTSSSVGQRLAASFLGIADVAVEKRRRRALGKSLASN